MACSVPICEQCTYRHIAFSTFHVVHIVLVV